MSNRLCKLKISVPDREVAGRRRAVLQDLKFVTEYIKRALDKYPDGHWAYYRSSPPVEEGRIYFWELVQSDSRVSKYIGQWWHEKNRYEQRILWLQYQNDLLYQSLINKSRGWFNWAFSSPEKLS